MAASPQGRGVIGRVAPAIACIAIVAATLVPVAGCDSAASSPTYAASPTASPDGGSGPTAAAGGSADSDLVRPQDAGGHASRVRTHPAPTVAVDAEGTYSWAYLDRVTGTRYQSDNADVTSYTESMVKSWLAADNLARAEAAGRQPDLDLIQPMILDSDDDAAETVWLRNGADRSIERMIDTCQLTDTRVYSGWWSKTLMSANDALRLGECIADGTAAGPTWTGWLLDEMRQVRGEGRFGVIDALTPETAANVAIKNGWTLHYDDDEWRVNCLAIHPDWIIAVMTTYPGELGLSYGSRICTEITTQILGPVGD